MIRKPREAVALACALATAAVLVTAGMAQIRSNSVSLSDPAGDGASAPDITSVDVSNDDAGNLSFKIGLGNRSTLAGEDWVIVFLDVDDVQDAEGNVHPEYGLGADSEGTTLYDLRGESAQAIPSVLLTNFSATLAGGLLTVNMNQRDLGDATALNLWLQSGTNADESRDDAPDGTSVWEYSIVSPALYVLSFSPPKAAKAGGSVVATMDVRGAHEATSKVTCAASIAGRAVRGKADWFKVFLGSTGNPGTSAVLKEQPRCTWAVPRNTKGKLLRGAVTVTTSGHRVTRSFSLRIR
jgi:hypothetical protein